MAHSLSGVGSMHIRARVGGRRRAVSKDPADFAPILDRYVPDRDLDVEARDFLHGVLGCIQPALDALKPLAEGKRRTRLQQLVLGR